MTPETLLQHMDEGRIWPDESLASMPDGVVQAYKTALQVRQL